MKKTDLQRLRTAPVIAFTTADGLIDDQISGEALTYVHSIANRRQAEATAARRRDRHGAEAEDGGLIHLLGACGEYATACVLGVLWSGSVNTFKAPDILDFIQVRTRSEPWHDLIVRDGDNSRETFVLVTLDLTATPPLLTVQGAIEGVDAKQPWRRGNPGGRGTVFLVAAAQLQPLTCAPLLDRIAPEHRLFIPF